MPSCVPITFHKMNSQLVGQGYSNNIWALHFQWGGRRASAIASVALNKSMCTTKAQEWGQGGGQMRLYLCICVCVCVCVCAHPCVHVRVCSLARAISGDWASSGRSSAISPSPDRCCIKCNGAWKTGNKSDKELYGACSRSEWQLTC